MASSQFSSPYTNHLGQPVGEPLPDWTARPRPPRTVMTGRLCRLEPIDAGRHSEALFEAHALDVEGRNWTYVSSGPFGSVEEMEALVKSAEQSEDPMAFAIIDLATERAAGWASYLSIDPSNGVIEVGMAYSPLLQRTPAATEAMYLMVRRAFDELGYRRYEWKCNVLNEASWRAAERLGFIHEGILRQGGIYKGRNRDRAFFSIIDKEWPGVRSALEGWLDPSNFDAEGVQKRRLGDFMANARKMSE